MTLSNSIRQNCCGTTCDKVEHARGVKKIEVELSIVKQLAYQSLLTIQNGDALELAALQEQLELFFLHNPIVNR